MHGYQGESINLVLPEDLTVFDIDWLSLYCIQYSENFGEVFFRQDIVRRGDIVPHLASIPVGVSVDGNHGRQGQLPQNGGLQGYTSQNGQPIIQPNNNYGNVNNRGYATQNGQQHPYNQNNLGFATDNLPLNGPRRSFTGGVPQTHIRSRANRNDPNRGYNNSPL